MLPKDGHGFHHARDWFREPNKYEHCAACRGAEQQLLKPAVVVLKPQRWPIHARISSVTAAAADDGATTATRERDAR